MLTSSSDSNYVPNEHEDVDQYDPYAIPSEIMPYQSNPESLLNQDESPINLSNSSGNHYVLNEHEDSDQYGSFTIPSKIMPY